jgi:hypothetical protein
VQKYFLWKSQKERLILFCQQDMTLVKSVGLKSRVSSKQARMYGENKKSLLGIHNLITSERLSPRLIKRGKR